MVFPYHILVLSETEVQEKKYASANTLQTSVYLLFFNTLLFQVSYVPIYNNM